MDWLPVLETALPKVEQAALGAIERKQQEKLLSQARADKAAVMRYEHKLNMLKHFEQKKAAMLGQEWDEEKFWASHQLELDRLQYYRDNMSAKYSGGGRSGGGSAKPVKDRYKSDVDINETLTKTLNSKGLGINTEQVRQIINNPDLSVEERVAQAQGIIMATPVDTSFVEVDEFNRYRAEALEAVGTWGKATKLDEAQAGGEKYRVVPTTPGLAPPPVTQQPIGLGFNRLGGIHYNQQRVTPTFRSQDIDGG